MMEVFMLRKKIILLLSAWLLIQGGCSRGPKPEGSGFPPFLIDSHIHYRATDEWEKAFLATYTKFNAMACVLISMEALDRGIAFAKKHPDRVIPYAAVDIDSKTILEDIRRVHAMGFSGLGELFAVNQWNYDDPRYDPVWALAESLSLPLAPHTGVLYNGQMSRMRPGYVATMASKHRKLFIHAAHFGNPWYNEAGEAARRCGNLFFDITGSSLIKKDHDPSFWAQFLWWTPHLGKAHMPKSAVPAFEKLVFGTDQKPGDLEENIVRFNRMLDACGVSAASREKIYYGTLAGIHGIDVTKHLSR
jgi:predicted TIM-barrel fold metal-dependent hydrolase